MASLTQQPQLLPAPTLEPPGFDLLRDLITRKLFSLESNPYNYDPSQGFSPQQLFNVQGRGLMNPYSGGYSSGWSPITPNGGSGVPSGGGMPPGMPPMGAPPMGGGGGATLNSGAIPQEGANNPSAGIISQLSNAFGHDGLGYDAIGSPAPMVGPQPGGLRRPSMPGVMMPTSHHPFGARAPVMGEPPNKMAVIHAILAKTHGMPRPGMPQPVYGSTMLGHDATFTGPPPDSVPSVSGVPTESANPVGGGGSWNPKVGMGPSAGGGNPMLAGLSMMNQENAGNGQNRAWNSTAANNPWAGMNQQQFQSAMGNNVGGGGLFGLNRQAGPGWQNGPQQNLPGMTYTGAQHEWGGNPMIGAAASRAGWNPQQTAQWTLQGELAQNPTWGAYLSNPGHIGMDGIGYDSPYMFQRGPQAPLGMDSNQWNTFGNTSGGPTAGSSGTSPGSGSPIPILPGGGGGTGTNTQYGGSPGSNLYGGSGGNPMNFGQPMSPWLMGYQGRYTAPMSPYEQGALGGYTNFLGGGLGLNPASGYYNNELGGQYLNLSSNPYLQQIQQGMQGMKNYNDQQALGQIGSSMAAGGNALSGARLGATSDYLRNSNNQFQSTMGQLMNQNYQLERGLQNQAPGGLANLANTIGSAYGQEFGMGALPRSLQQNDLNSQYQDFLRQAGGMQQASLTPDQMLMQYLQSGRYSGQYQPMYGSSTLDQIAGLLGGNSGLTSLLGDAGNSLLGLLGGGGTDGVHLGYDSTTAPGTSGPANYYDRNWYNNALTNAEATRATQMASQANGPNTTAPAILTILASLLGSMNKGGGGRGAGGGGGSPSGAQGNLSRLGQALFSKNPYPYGSALSNEWNQQFSASGAPRQPGDPFDFGNLTPGNNVPIQPIGSTPDNPLSGGGDQSLASLLGGLPSLPADNSGGGLNNLAGGYGGDLNVGDGSSGD